MCKILSSVTVDFPNGKTLVGLSLVIRAQLASSHSGSRLRAIPNPEVGLSMNREEFVTASRICWVYLSFLLPLMFFVALVVRSWINLETTCWVVVEELSV